MTEPTAYMAKAQASRAAHPRIWMARKTPALLLGPLPIVLMQRHGHQRLTDDERVLGSERHERFVAA